MKKTIFIIAMFIGAMASAQLPPAIPAPGGQLVYNPDCSIYFLILPQQIPGYHTSITQNSGGLYPQIYGSYYYQLNAQVHQIHVNYHSNISGAIMGSYAYELSYMYNDWKLKAAEQPFLAKDTDHSVHLKVSGGLPPYNVSPVAQSSGRDIYVTSHNWAVEDASGCIVQSSASTNKK